MKKLPGGTQIYHSTSKLKNRVKQFLLKTSIFENMGFTKVYGPGVPIEETLPDIKEILEMAASYRFAQPHKIHAQLPHLRHGHGTVFDRQCIDLIPG